MATSAHFIVNTLALKRGGLVKAVRERASALAATGILEKVQIDVLGIQPRLEADVAELKRDGHLHGAVVVQSVLAALDRSGPETRIPVVVAEEPGVSSYPAEAKSHAFRLFRDGLYERYVRFDGNGVPIHIDYFSPSRYRIRREEMDGAGRVVRIQEYQQGSTSATVQRLIGRDGACYATIWQKPGETAWGSSFLHGPELHLPSTGRLYARAFELLLAGEENPAICAEFRENLPNLPSENLDDVVRAISHPNLLKIATIHSNHYDRPYVRGSGTSPNWKRLLENLDEFDALVALTPAQKQDIAAEAGHAEMISVIGQIAPPPAPLTAVDPLRLVLVARTHPKKRVDEAMRVMAHVLTEEPDAVLEVFGFGYGDAEEKMIKELIAELGIADSVRFMPFANGTDEIYAGACATLLTSASEGFPLTLLESMSHGVPVLAYDANYGPRDVIKDGINGFLVPFGENEALARRVVELIRNPALRASMASASQETLADFGPEDFSDRWLKLIATSPRPMRIRGATVGPLVRSVRWINDTLELTAQPDVPEGTVLVMTDRGSGVPEAEAALAGGSWSITLPSRPLGSILDIHAVVAGGRKRIQSGQVKQGEGTGWRIYATQGGWLSLKAVSPRQMKH